MVRGYLMNNWFSILSVFVLAVLSIGTGEIVTFIMLGIILITLQNIHRTLKELVKVKKEESD